MNIRLLSAILGYIPVVTTLGIYTYLTGNVQRVVVTDIERGIGKTTTP